MIVLVIIGVVLLAFAIGIVTHVLSPKSEQQAKTIGQIGTYGFSRRGGDGDDATGRMRERFDNLAGWLGSRMVGRGGDSTNLDRIRAQLVAAGLYQTSPGKFLGYRVLCTIGLPLLWIWFGVTVHVSPVLLVIVTLLAIAGGWFLPLQFVKDQANRRLDEIDYQLPELIDLIVVTVEAGLGFVGSLQMASDRLTGPLGDELRLTLQEQNMGLSINEALANTMARCDTPSMRSFVRSIVQGETLGVSIGRILRDLATEMRRRRKANAEERAQKAPIKILFPLVFLIFPAMFIVLLGPALAQFLHAIRGVSHG